MNLPCTTEGTTADRTTVVAAHDGVRVEVDDRTGWNGAGPDVWRPPLDRVPCGHGGTPDVSDALPTEGTEQEALSAALGVLSPDHADSRVRLFEDGYWRMPGHGFVVLRPGEGSVFWGRTEPVGEGRWQANFTELTCPPA